MYRYENATHCSASMGTTQGLMLVAKFLAVKGPRGTYSHCLFPLHGCVFVCVHEAYERMHVGRVYLFMDVWVVGSRGVGRSNRMDRHTYMYVGESRREFQGPPTTYIWVTHCTTYSPAPPTHKNKTVSTRFITRDPPSECPARSSRSSAPARRGGRRPRPSSGACLRGRVVGGLGGGVSGRRYIIPMIAVTRQYIYIK